MNFVFFLNAIFCNEGRKLADFNLEVYLLSSYNACFENFMVKKMQSNKVLSSRENPKASILNATLSKQVISCGYRFNCIKKYSKHFCKPYMLGVISVIPRISSKNIAKLMCLNNLKLANQPMSVTKHTYNIT